MSDDDDYSEDLDGTLKQKSYARFQKRQTSTGHMQRENVRVQTREARELIRGAKPKEVDEVGLPQESNEEQKFRMKKLYAAQRRGWQTRTSNLGDFLGFADDTDKVLDPMSVNSGGNGDGGENDYGDFTYVSKNSMAALEAIRKEREALENELLGSPSKSSTRTRSVPNEDSGSGVGKKGGVLSGIGGVLGLGRSDEEEKDLDEFESGREPFQRSPAVAGSAPGEKQTNIFDRISGAAEKVVDAADHMIGAAGEKLPAMLRSQSMPSNFEIILNPPAEDNAPSEVLSPRSLTPSPRRSKSRSGKKSRDRDRDRGERRSGKSRSKRTGGSTRSRSEVPRKSRSRRDRDSSKPSSSSRASNRRKKNIRDEIMASARRSRRQSQDSDRVSFVGDVEENSRKSKSRSSRSKRPSLSRRKSLGVGVGRNRGMSKLKLGVQEPPSVKQRLKDKIDEAEHHKSGSSPRPNERATLTNMTRRMRDKVFRGLFSRIDTEFTGEVPHTSIDTLVREALVYVPTDDDIDQWKAWINSGESLSGTSRIDPQSMHFEIMDREFNLSVSKAVLHQFANTKLHKITEDDVTFEAGSKYIVPHSVVEQCKAFMSGTSGHVDPSRAYIKEIWRYEDFVELCRILCSVPNIHLNTEMFEEVDDKGLVSRRGSSAGANVASSDDEDLDADVALENYSHMDLEMFLDVFQLPGAMGGRLFNVLDRDKKGYVDYDATIINLSSINTMNGEKKVELLFNLCDTNRDGDVSRYELTTLLHALVALSYDSIPGAVVEDHVIKAKVKAMVLEAFDKCDTNRDNKLQIDEFKRWILETPMIKELLDGVFKSIEDAQSAAKYRRDLVRQVRKSEHRRTLRGSQVTPGGPEAYEAPSARLFGVLSASASKDALPPRHERRSSGIRSGVSSVSGGSTRRTSFAALSKIELIKRLKEAKQKYKEEKRNNSDLSVEMRREMKDIEATLRARLAEETLTHEEWERRTSEIQRQLKKTKDEYESLKASLVESQAMKSSSMGVGTYTIKEDEKGELDANMKTPKNNRADPYGSPLTSARSERKEDTDFSDWNTEDDTASLWGTPREVSHSKMGLIRTMNGYIPEPGFSTNDSVPPLNLSPIKPSGPIHKSFKSGSHMSKHNEGIGHGYSQNDAFTHGPSYHGAGPHPHSTGQHPYPPHGANMPPYPVYPYPPYYPYPPPPQPAQQIPTAEGAQSNPNHPMMNAQLQMTYEQFLQFHETNLQARIQKQIEQATESSVNKIRRASGQGPEGEVDIDDAKMGELTEDELTKRALINTAPGATGANTTNSTAAVREGYGCRACAADTCVIL